MKVNHSGNKRIILAIGVVLVFISLQIGWWITLSLDQQLSYAQLQDEFLRPYPAFFASARTITGLNLLLVLICWFWIVRMLIREPKLRIGWATLVWSSVLLIWLGFSLS